MFKSELHISFSQWGSSWSSCGLVAEAITVIYERETQIPNGRPGQQANMKIMLKWNSPDSEKDAKIQ